MQEGVRSLGCGVIGRCPIRMCFRESVLRGAVILIDTCNLFEHLFYILNCHSLELYQLNFTKLMQAGTSHPALFPGSFTVYTRSDHCRPSAVVPGSDANGSLITNQVLGPGLFRYGVTPW